MKRYLSTEDLTRYPLRVCAAAEGVRVSRLAWELQQRGFFFLFEPGGVRATREDNPRRGKPRIRKARGLVPQGQVEAA